ncbi:hypothetical protein FDZ74_14295, partial [bacterium]
MVQEASGLPGGKGGDPGKEMSGEGFAALLSQHLSNGTRPGLRLGAVGNVWTARAFGRATQVSERTVRNWRSGSTLPDDAGLQNILDALFGDDPSLVGARCALENAWDIAQRRRSAETLATAAPEPDGLDFVEGVDSLEIRPAPASDHTAARDPVVRRRLPIIAEKLRDLAETIGSRLDNQRGWRLLRRRVQSLLDLVDGQPAEAIPERLVELYDWTISLASFVEFDDGLERNAAAADEPLDPDIRRALVDVLSTMAPWLRTFPSVLTWDSEKQSLLSRAQAFETARAMLRDAEAFIRMAGATGALSLVDAERAVEPLETAKRTGFQAEKAGYRGLATARNLLSRSVRVLALGSTFFMGTVYSNFATKSALLQSIGTFL